jgi:hypothetical protein
MSNSIFDDFNLFAQLMNGLNPEIMPDGDAQDFTNGATYIPGEVTDKRRNGERIIYIPEHKIWKDEQGKVYQ